MPSRNLQAFIGFVLLLGAVIFFREDHGSIPGLIGATLLVAAFWYLNGLNFAISSLRNMLMLASLFGAILLAAQFLFPSDSDSAKMGQLEGTDLNPAQIAHLKESHDIAMQLYLDHRPTNEERYFRVGALPWTHDGFHYQAAKTTLDAQLMPHATEWVHTHLAASDIDRDVAEIETWYRSKFAYTLAPGAIKSAHPLDEFLFETRKGFCEHYAASVATLLKLRGHRAQVAVGYAGGSYNSLMRRLTYEESDAHAWVEVADPLTHQWRIVDPTDWVMTEAATHERTDWMPYVGYAAFFLVIFSGAVVFFVGRRAEAIEALQRKVGRKEEQRGLLPEGLTLSERIARLASLEPSLAERMQTSLSAYLTAYFAAEPTPRSKRELARSLRKW